jgi:hypothetical protein
MPHLSHIQLLILWFIGMYTSWSCVEKFAGMRAVADHFPDTWRWWIPICQTLSMAAFGFLCFYTP